MMMAVVMMMMVMAMLMMVTMLMMMAVLMVRPTSHHQNRFRKSRESIEVKVS